MNWGEFLLDCLLGARFSTTKNTINAKVQRQRNAEASGS